MAEAKQRDYMFDIFRGLLMLSIPISHFTKMSGNLYGSLFLNGGFYRESLFGFVYITINVFVMQAFMFLSGYFSKNYERAQQSAFKTFMWPYLVFTFVYYLIRIFFFGNAHLTFLSPPFALWFLFALFFYRFFLKYMMRFKWLFPLSFILFIVAGYVKEWGDYLALGRTMSYFIFFLVGVYCSKERLAWLRQLKKYPIVLFLLFVALCAASVALCYVGPKNVGWYLLRESYHSFGITWWQDSLLRIMLFVLAMLWILLCINVLPSKQCFLSYVGSNTMPVYVFHLTLRYVIQFFGMYINFVACLVVAWFGILGVIFKKYKNNTLYGICIVLSLIGAYFLFSSGVLNPYVGLTHPNIWVTYIICYASALIAGCSFVSPFWIKLYDTLVDGPAYFPKSTKFLKGPGYDENASE